MKLIENELKDYPKIDFRRKEIGLSFQIQFVKLYYYEMTDKELPDQSTPNHTSTTP